MSSRSSIVVARVVITAFVLLIAVLALYGVVT